MRGAAAHPQRRIRASPSLPRPGLLARHLLRKYGTRERVTPVEGSVPLLGMVGWVVGGGRDMGEVGSLYLRGFGHVGEWVAIGSADLKKREGDAWCRLMGEPGGPLFKERGRDGQGQVATQETLPDGSIICESGSLISSVAIMKS